MYDNNYAFVDDSNEELVDYIEKPEFESFYKACMLISLQTGLSLKNSIKWFEIVKDYMNKI